MLAITKRTIKINIKKLLIYLAVSILLTWMLVAIYPSFSENSQEMVDSYPREAFEFTGIDADEFLASLEGFIAAEHYSIMWPIIMIVFVVSYATSTIAGEIEDGSIELLLTQPISRISVFLSKYVSGLVLTLILVTASSLATVPIALIHQIDFNGASYFYISVIGFLFSLTIYSLTFLFSAISSNRSKAMSLTLFIVILMYAIQIVAYIEDSVNFLKYISFFHYYDFNAAMLDEHISLLSVAIFGLTSITSTVAGLLYFNKRDIAA